MSSFAQGYSLAEARLLITLSGLAYLDSDPLPDETVEAQAARMKADINAALADAGYASWQVVWTSTRSTPCAAPTGHSGSTGSRTSLQSCHWCHSRRSCRSFQAEHRRLRRAPISASIYC